MSSNQYAVTAHRATQVNHSLVGRFTSPDDLNLILCKCNRIEIHLLTADGLTPVVEFGIYGRVSALQLFQPTHEDSQSELLLVVTEHYKMCILAFDPELQGIVTKANGDLSDRVGRPIDDGMFVHVDTQCRMIAAHLYDSLLKVIPLVEKGYIKEAFNIRLEETNIIDMVFIKDHDDSSGPTLALLYRDSKDRCHVRVYACRLRDKELEPLWGNDEVESGAQFLIPGPKGGVIVVGERFLAFMNGKTRGYAYEIKFNVFRCHAAIPNDTRYILADYRGFLHVLDVTADASSGVTRMEMMELGRTNLASNVSYLDNAIVFVGSEMADSQTIKLLEEPDEGGSYIELIESYTNLGPIVDFCVVDLDRQGQGQIVTCSGAYQDGSLRVIRNGIGINELATIELEDIKGVWSLRGSSDSEFDQYLVLSFVGETRILSMEDEDIEEAEIDSFEGESQTLHCANVEHNQIIQITSDSVRLIKGGSLDLVDEWKPKDGKSINVASANETQILLSTGGGQLNFIEIEEGSLVVKSETRVEHEVSCIDISPLQQTDKSTKFAAVGLWTDISVRLLELPTLEQKGVVTLGGEVLPRSVLFAAFSDHAYLFVALGDGHVFRFQFNPHTWALSSKKKMSLGTQPVTLTRFASQREGATGETMNIFASSDRPTVIYNHNGKVVYSNVNLREVTHTCSFHNEAFPNSLTIVTEHSLTIGTMDNIQKLHIRDVPLGAMPRRITYQESTHTFGVIVQKFEVTPSNTLKEMDDTADSEESEAASSTTATAAVDAAAAAAAVEVLEDSSEVRLIHGQTFECIGTYPLQETEQGTAIVSMRFVPDPVYGDIASGLDDKDKTKAKETKPVVADDSEYYVVGTTFAPSYEQEPTRGRLLVFRMNEQNLSLVHETQVNGAVYALTAFNGRIAVAVGPRAEVYEWSQTSDDGLFALKQVATRLMQVMCTSIATRGDYILVGDLMKSMSLLQFDKTQQSVQKSLVERARDYNPNWTTSVEFLGHSYSLFIGAENSCNLFVARRDSDAPTEDERSRMSIIGEFHIGDLINRIRPGSIVMQTAATSSSSMSSDGVVAMESSSVGDGNETGVESSSSASASGTSGAGVSASDLSVADPPLSTLVYCTVGGAIGIVAQLTDNEFQFQKKLQEKLLSTIRGVGGLDHGEWRMFKSEVRTVPASGFVDGDLIESYLDLSEDKQQKVAADMNMTVDELVRHVESLAQRLH